MCEQQVKYTHTHACIPKRCCWDLSTILKLAVTTPMKPSGKPTKYRRLRRLHVSILKRQKMCLTTSKAKKLFNWVFRDAWEPTANIPQGYHNPTPRKGWRDRDISLWKPWYTYMLFDAVFENDLRFCIGYGIQYLKNKESFNSSRSIQLRDVDRTYFAWAVNISIDFEFDLQLSMCVQNIVLPW